VVSRLYTCLTGITSTVLQPNAQARSVTQRAGGHLDFVLLKPVDSAVLALGAQPSPPGGCRGGCRFFFFFFFPLLGL